MKKEQTIAILTDYLEQHEEIMFAYLFGSFVGSDRYRDIDIGIYRKSPDLMALGQLHTDLTGRIKKKIDLIYLNNLPDKHPALAHQIVCKGTLLFSKDIKLQGDYKQHAFLRYFDTAPLREKMRQTFEKRLQDDKFGMRNYA